MNKRRDPAVTPGFRKDERWERFIERLNELLAPAHDAELQDLPAGAPIVHVFGVPRSGTTLAVQLLASHLECGYIDNLAAAFWRAPVYGARLSRALLGTRRSSFESEFGRTREIQDPHEFGYFWSRWLAYREMAVPEEGHDASIDWPGLTRVLRNVAAEFTGPLVLKNFLAAWYLESLARCMPESKFIFIRRNLVDTAWSLLKMRDRFLGDRARWASLRPVEYAQLAGCNPHEQVAGQAYFLDRAISRNLALMPSSSILVASLERIVESPAAFLEQARAFLSGTTTQVAWRDREVALLRIPRVDHDEDRSLIERAIAGLRERDPE